MGDGYLDNKRLKLHNSNYLEIGAAEREFWQSQEALMRCRASKYAGLFFQAFGSMPYIWLCCLDISKISFFFGKFNYLSLNINNF